MIPARSMANDAQGIRRRRTSPVRRDVVAIGILGLALLTGALLLREPPAAPPPPRPGARPIHDPAPALPATLPAASGGAAEPADAPTAIPRTRAAKLRALRRAGITPRPGPDGKPTIDAGPVIELLNKAGVHDGIAVFPPPGTDPPKIGVVVPEGAELPEGYIRYFQSTDDGEPLPPILLFHPDYDFFDEQGRPIAIPPDRVVPPDLVPPGLPQTLLALPSRERGR